MLIVDIQIHVKPIIETDCDTIVTFLVEDNAGYGGATDAIDKATNGAVQELIDTGDFTGKSGQIAVIYPRGAISAKRVVLVGLGKSQEFSAIALRRAVATGMQHARKIKTKRVATLLVRGGGYNALTTMQSAQAVVEGAIMGLYTYRGQKSDSTPQDEIDELHLLVFDEADLVDAQAGANRGKAYGEGAVMARNLVNTPPNICTPAYLAERASDMAKAKGLRVEILEEGHMRALKMGALLGVAQGSGTTHTPRFIILEHNTDKAGTLPTIVLVGKGVTFDTGGYSIKTAEGMIGMKADMGGGGAVISAMSIIADLQVPLHVVGLVPAVENMISDKAYRPQDVLTASNGKTIEIISTDAEGRLILADALVYAKRYNPAAVVDIATLTGACVVALGKAAAGLFATDDDVANLLSQAGDFTEERVWRLPLYPEYDKAIESDTADIKNSGGPRNGVGTSAAFLKQFVDYPIWAHVDMAGTMLDAENNPTIPTKGATGYGARLLAYFAELWAQKSS
jgi:leucyl aminopeptidase